MTTYGTFRDKNHTYSVCYPAQDGIEPAIEQVLEANITGVVGMLDKSDALVGWAKREVALAAVRNVNIVTQMLEQQPLTPGSLGIHPAVQYLKGIPGYQRDKAADMGTRLHAVGEALSHGEKPVIDDDILPMAEAYVRGFIEKHKPKFHPDYIEYMVVSLEHQYAGTMDMTCRIGDDIWLLDIKTASDKPIGIDQRSFPYSSTALQLAAGRWADFMGRPNDSTRHPIPEATRFGVVAVTKTDCEVVEYAVTPADFETFLALRNAWGWDKTRKDAIKTGILKGAAA